MMNELILIEQRADALVYMGPEVSSDERVNRYNQNKVDSKLNPLSVFIHR